MNNPVDAVTVNKPADKADMSTVDIASIVEDTLALQEILDNETRWLKNMEVNKVKDVHDDKLRLIRRLEIQKQLVEHDPSLIGRGNDEERKYLLNLQANMEVSIKENFAEVLKAREINQRVVHVISGALNKHENRASGYNNSGMSSAGQSSSNLDSSYAISINNLI